MSTKQIAEKRYVVKLSDEERERLNTLIRVGKHPADNGTVQRSGGSCRFGKGQVGIGGPVKSMPNPGTERAVIDCATDLEQQIGAFSRPCICWDLFMRRLTRKFAVPSVIDVPTRRPARYRLA